MGFKNATADQEMAFLSALRAGQYNLLLGAGASLDASNARGGLLSGGGLKNELCKLKGVSESNSLTRVFGLLSTDEVDQHVYQRYVHCTPGGTAEAIRSFVWKRIFTWNIDDVMEMAYARGKGRQTAMSVHFADDYVEANDLTELLIIHLHGSVLDPAKGYVFSRNEYVNFVKETNPWMVNLSVFIASEPFIISGTSLDEVDLDYYLSYRSNISARSDRGPSILVDLPDDAISESICKKHNLLHFLGYSADFFEYCRKVLPNSPTPFELIPEDTKKLLPENASPSVVLKFMSDFEIVPVSGKPATLPSRFFFGHAASWSDLATDLDVSRNTVGRLVADLERRVGNGHSRRLVLLNQKAGTGKTTTIRRTAFELAKKGIRVLLASPLGRLSPDTCDLLNQIIGPLVVVVDDLAGQASIIANLLSKATKQDMVVLGTERAYRMPYVRQALAGTKYSSFDDLALNEVEATRLVQLYIDKGIVGTHISIKQPAVFARRIAGDPIAVACCRILNDLKPLERIVEEITADASKVDFKRYLTAAICRQCFRGGLPYDILQSVSGPVGLIEQFEANHQLPLAFSDAAGTFVIPENATLAEGVLERASSADRQTLYKVFVDLAQSLAPRVNRGTIIMRTPEARLAPRLFDYDDVVSKYLGDTAGTFYREIQPAWQWNSRYWEQVALLNLAEYQRDPKSTAGLDALDRAVRHARHAVSTELHPFPLTTLGKVLMTQMLVPGQNRDNLYEEAFGRLITAIEKEAVWSRSAPQPYTTLLVGTIRYLAHGGVLTNKQSDGLQEVVKSAENRLGQDPEIADLISDIRNKLNIA